MSPHGGFHGGGHGPAFHRGYGFGGWGGDYGGYPYYGAPCYGYDAYDNCIPYPVLPMEGSDMDGHALAQPSSFVSGYHRGHLYQNTLAQLAPILNAPSNIPSRVEVELHGHNLAVAIEIDGKVYQGTADLSQVFDVARHYLRAYHEQLHREGRLLVGGAAPSAEQAAGPVANHVVACGVDLLVGRLVEEHRRPYALLCAGFWDAVTHDLKSAEHAAERGIKDIAEYGTPEGLAYAAVEDARHRGHHHGGRHTEHVYDVRASGWWGNLERSLKHDVSSLEHDVTKTLKTLAPVIQTAAAGAAAAFVGPEAAPLASSLTGSLIQAATGGGSAAQAAQSVVQQATQMAQSNPQVASALSAAQQAVSQTTAGYHAAQTFANAAAGNAGALQQVQELTQAASGGDQAAQGALNAAQQAASQFTSGASGALSDLTQDLSSVVQGVPSPRELASQAAKEFPAKVIGVALTTDGNWHLKGFANADAADDWFGGYVNQPETFLYVAYFDKGDPTFPHPLNEQTGAHAPAVSGALGALALLAAGAAAGYYGPTVYEWGRARWAEHEAKAKAQAGK